MCILSDSLLQEWVPQVMTTTSSTVSLPILVCVHVHSFSARCVTICVNYNSNYMYIHGCVHIPSMSCIHLQELPREAKLGRGHPHPKLRLPFSESSDTVNGMLLEPT